MLRWRTKIEWNVQVEEQVKGRPRRQQHLVHLMPGRDNKRHDCITGNKSKHLCECHFGWVWLRDLQKGRDGQRDISCWNTVSKGMSDTRKDWSLISSSSHPPVMASIEVDGRPVLFSFVMILVLLLHTLVYKHVSLISFLPMSGILSLILFVWLTSFHESDWIELPSCVIWPLMLPSLHCHFLCLQDYQCQMMSWRVIGEDCLGSRVEIAFQVDPRESPSTIKRM